MNEMRKLMESIQKINEEPQGPYSIANDDAELYIARVAQALAKDAVEQAAGVYDEEGDGEGKFRTGAQNKHQYVNIAAKRFLSPDYKRDILHALQQEFDQAVEEELRNYSETR